MTETSNYRRLGRNGSAGLFGHRARGVSSLLALLALALVLFLSHQYLATSGELDTARAELGQCREQGAVMRGEMLDAKVKLEQVQKAEAECRKKQTEMGGKLETCQTEKDVNKKLLTEMETGRSECEKKLDQLKMEERTKTQDMSAANQKQAKLITNLTETIRRLRQDLAAYGNSAPPNVVMAIGVSNGAAAQVPTENSTTELETGSVDTVTGTVSTPMSTKSAKHRKFKDTAHEQDEPAESAEQQQKRQQQQEDALRAQQQGVVDFNGPHRAPGGRIHLEEVAARREKLTGNNRELLKMAAKVDRQREREPLFENREQPKYSKGERPADPGFEDGAGGGLEVPALNDIEKDDQHPDNARKRKK